MADDGARERATRANRGNRMGALINQAEGDDEFWGQDAWKEEAADEEYKSEKEEADVFDSDFGDEESDEEEEDEDQDDRPRKKPGLKPPGQPKRVTKPAAGKPAPPPRPLSDLEAAANAAADGQALPHAGAQQARQVRQAPVALTADMIRKSKRALVLEADVHRERARAEEAARPKPVKIRKVTDERPPTQEEMLAEAAETELFNTADLQRILALEEETKRRAVVVKKDYDGPLVRFRSSREGGDQLLFLRGADPQLSAPGTCMPTAPPAVVCAVTGRPAKYRDPKTELPYADAAAMRIIRRAADAQQLHLLPFLGAAKQSARRLEQFKQQRTGMGVGGAAHNGAVVEPTAA